jgi:hypothetical protein
VEHFPEVVLQAIQTTPEMYEWFINEWVHLAVIHPQSHQILYYKRGSFEQYDALTKALPGFDDINQLLEDAQPMRTNQLPDATQENLPVYLNS